jgi:hypothetical protein
MVKAYPYTRYCKGTCLSGAAIADLQRRIDAGLPLFDNMRCADCGGELRVYAPRIDAKYSEIVRTCDTCRDRKWDTLQARVQAQP